MASGCSAWTSSDRSPATGADRSPFSRHVTLPGPKNPSSAGLSGTLAVNAAAARSTRPAVGNTSAVIASPPVPTFQPAYHQRYLAVGGPPSGWPRRPPTGLLADPADGELGQGVAERVHGRLEEVVADHRGGLGLRRGDQRLGHARQARRLLERDVLRLGIKARLGELRLDKHSAAEARV